MGINATGNKLINQYKKALFMKQEIKTTKPDSKEGLHTQGEIIYHKHWGKCEVIKQIDTNGYVVQSEKKPKGEYLNVNDWDFEDGKDRVFIDKVMKEAANKSYTGREIGIFVSGAIYAKQLKSEEAVNERKALLDALEKVNQQIDLHIKHKDIGIGWLETAKETIQTALNNAKNI